MTEHYCEIHNCKFYRNEKDGKAWYSHKIKDGTGYCNEPKEETIKDPTSLPVETPKKHESSPETGMWWNQLGEMMRCGDIDKTTPQGKVIRKAYYTEMFRVLGINVQEVTQHN